MHLSAPQRHFVESPACDQPQFQLTTDVAHAHALTGLVAARVQALEALVAHAPVFSWEMPNATLPDYGPEVCVS